VPKALLPVAGRPFIAWQLDFLAHQGITHVVLCLGFLGKQIQAVVGDGTAFGVSIGYAYDGDTLLGTGGALRHALPLLGDSFFVLYGDSYVTCSFAQVQAAYNAAEAPGLMTVLRNEDRWDKSNVLYRDGKIVEYNKRSPTHDMAHIDYGLGILSARTLRERPDGTGFDLADLYGELALRGELAGLEIGGRFYEIGSPAGLDDTERYLRTCQPAVEVNPCATRADTSRRLLRSFRSSTSWRSRRWWRSSPGSDRKVAGCSFSASGAVPQTARMR
jgi:NDP-sugar pyrophosphorylase family protein